MCLIISGPSAQLKSTLLNTTGLITDIFTSNGDGLGVMYKNKHGLRVVKQLPKSVLDARRLIETLPDDDRSLCMHWRMRTHGDTDLANCHPYDVVPGKVAMVHNGILDTGNAADKSKSDTWHFIQDFLAGPVALSTDLVHEPSFLALIAEFIGDNRFVFMDDQGRMSIVNKDQGVTHGDLWFSNTYAWDPALLIPSYKRRYPRFSGAGWGMDDDDEADWVDYYNSRGKAAGAGTSDRNRKWDHEDARNFCEAVNNCEQEVTARTLNVWPYSAIEALFDRFEAKPVESVVRNSETALSPSEAKILRAIEQHDAKEVAMMATHSPNKVADVLCYYTNWYPKTAATAAKGEPAPAGTELTAHRREYSYDDFTIFVEGDDAHGLYDYVSFDAVGNEFGKGYAFGSRNEALTWACEEIDEFTGAKLYDAPEPDQPRFTADDIGDSVAAAVEHMREFTQTH